MRIFAAARNNAGLALIAFVLAFVVTGVFAHRVDAVGVGVVLCGSQSNITVTEPESDKVLTESELPIKGVVNQAAQIEITLDDVFNSVVPLNLGQTAFDTTVHLTPGTHTIKLTAINVCDSGTNSSTTLVVTYSPPPERNANGEAAINPSDDSAGVVGDGISDSTGATQAGLGWLEPLRDNADNILRILDIQSLEGREGKYSQLSIIRAAVLVAGLYLLAFGATLDKLVKFVSRLPIIRSFSAKPIIHKRLTRWTIRVAGLLLFVGGLLL